MKKIGIIAALAALWMTGCVGTPAESERSSHLCVAPGCDDFGNCWGPQGDCGNGGGSGGGNPVCSTAVCNPNSCSSVGCHHNPWEDVGCYFDGCGTCPDSSALDTFLCDASCGSREAPSYSACFTACMNSVVRSCVP